MESLKRNIETIHILILCIHLQNWDSVLSDVIALRVAIDTRDWIKHSTEAFSSPRSFREHGLIVIMSYTYFLRFGAGGDDTLG